MCWEEVDGVKVITRTDLGVEATPQISDSIGHLQHILSAKYGCPVEVDSVDYAYTPFYIDDFREDMAEMISIIVVILPLIPPKMILP